VQASGEAEARVETPHGSQPAAPDATEVGSPAPACVADEGAAKRGATPEKPLGSAALRERVAELDRQLHAGGKKPNRETLRALRKLEKNCLPRLEKYERRDEILGKRSSFAHTDADATAMRLKEDRGALQPLPRPAYNVQCGTENQFILGFVVEQQPADTDGFIPLMEQLRKNTGGRQPDDVTADSAYGSEENHVYCEEHGVGNYLQYNTFDQETHPRRARKGFFRFEDFRYEAESDSFLCPAGQRLSFRHRSHEANASGYVPERRVYECADCAGCALRSRCARGKGNRQVSFSPRLQEYRRQARENLTSEKGRKLRIMRSTEVEAVFGQIKQNMGFRRFHLRGLEKVKTEWGLVSIAHNMIKLAA
jgi:hypothetical protein